MLRSREERLSRRTDAFVALLDDTDATLMDTIRATVIGSSDKIVESFYATLMGNPEAATYLSHALVQTRLRAALGRWLGQVFSVRSAEEAATLLRAQEAVGAIHARVEMPLCLLAQAARIIRRVITEELGRAGWDGITTANAVRIADDLVDLAIEGMNEAYLGDLMTSARRQQALQLVTAGHAFALECERMRTSLFQWHRGVLLGLWRQGVTPSPLAATDIALWVTHRAPLTLGDGPQLDALRAGMAALERAGAELLGTREAIGTPTEVGLAAFCSTAASSRRCSRRRPACPASMAASSACS
ncbi:MAG: hypothetical protein CVU56_23090 [Deltaproteobacteria bacterium HGW-Deltaproteobacteria-14]|nr:MAG: hypothetical protein CVU56_23090 [Deltaproteobacteria bacterium HGW-Deltaproteobacteria-14]